MPDSIQDTIQRLQTTRPLTEEEQGRLLAQIKDATKGRGQSKDRHILLCGAMTALQICGITMPPYWTINLMCGRTDRLFNQ